MCSSKEFVIKTCNRKIVTITHVILTVSDSPNSTAQHFFFYHLRVVSCGIVCMCILVSVWGLYVESGFLKVRVWPHRRASKRVCVFVCVREELVQKCMKWEVAF